jgi:hypothetical protein
MVKVEFYDREDEERAGGTYVFKTKVEQAAFLQGCKAANCGCSEANPVDSKED